jgi:hypothetical protein
MTTVASERASYGGYERARRYEPLILQEWGSLGGRAILKKFGREYFVRLRKRRKIYPKRKRKRTGRYARSGKTS